MNVSKVPTLYVKIKELVVNDQLDLEDDNYADKYGNNVDFQFEYTVVDAPPESEDHLIVLHTSHGRFAFPSDYGFHVRCVAVVFIPQQLIDGTLYGADDEGPNQWAVRYPESLVYDPEIGWDELENTPGAANALKDHPDAPEWVKQWTGPYEIAICR